MLAHISYGVRSNPEIALAVAKWIYLLGRLHAGGMTRYHQLCLMISPGIKVLRG